MVLDMRGTIKMLQEDCRNLASALNQMTQGADVEAVLQNLPPTLLQVRRRKQLLLVQLLLVQLLLVQLLLVQQAGEV
jgi:hypothetical protein